MTMAAGPTLYTVLYNAASRKLGRVERHLRRACQRIFVHLEPDEQRARQTTDTKDT